jgi:hypothetical protein
MKRRAGSYERYARWGVVAICLFIGFQLLGPGIVWVEKQARSAIAAETAVTIPTHFKTMDYGDAYMNRGRTYVYNASDVRWLSMVQVGSNSSARLDYSVYRQAGIKIARYVFAYAVVGGADPQSPYYEALGGQGTSTTYQPSTGFAHTCSGDLLVDVEGRGRWLMVNWTSPVAAQAFRFSYLNNPPKMNAPIDFWYLDGSTYLSDYYDAVTGRHDVPCVNGRPATQATWDAATRPIFASLGIPIINDGGGQQQYIGAPFVGQRKEGPYISGGVPRLPPYWQQSENNEIRMALAHEIWIAQNKDERVYPTTPTGMAHRMFGLASFLLTYDLDTSYYWYAAHGAGIDDDPDNPSGEHIFPEEWFVPIDPIQPEPTDIEQLRDSGGAYYREYKDCGYQGQWIGRCVVVVNPFLAPVTWPGALALYQQATAHELEIHNGNGLAGSYCLPNPSQPCKGAEIPDGGYLTFDGPAAPPSIPAQSAVIVVSKS